VKTHATAADWGRFAYDVIRMARGLPSLKAAADASTTKGAVYTAADVEHASRIYNFDVKDVIAVGNPDLTRFKFTPHMLGIKNSRASMTENCVMYIDTALAIVGLLYKSQSSFIEHLVRTAEALESQGKRMAFKPHPAHDWKKLRESLNGTNIELVSNDEFLLKLEECCACITETTSVALLPALLGMPLLYARYGELSGQRFGPVLTSYPRGYMLDDLSRVTDILSKDAIDFDCDAVSDWIAFNAGPLPAEDMPRRVADIVESLIQEASQARS
jgi:hypothetical protein